MVARNRHLSTASKSSLQAYSCEPRLRLVSVEQFGATAEGPSVRGPETAREALTSYFLHRDREHFVVLHLDAAHHAVSAEVVAVGTLTLAPVHPREVFKGAMLANAAAIICAHNHPSGDLTPSPEDRTVFDSLSAASTLLRIPLLDFLIFAGDGCWSAVEHGAWPLPPRSRV